MKTVSIQELKRNLSGYLSEAAAGEAIVVTRHRKPMVRISATELPHVHVGPNVGRGTIEAAFTGGTGGRILEILQEDRRDRMDELFP